MQFNAAHHPVPVPPLPATLPGEKTPCVSARRSAAAAQVLAWPAPQETSNSGVRGILVGLAIQTGAVLLCIGSWELFRHVL